MVVFVGDHCYNRGPNFSGSKFVFGDSHSSSYKSQLERAYSVFRLQTHPFSQATKKCNEDTCLFLIYKTCKVTGLGYSNRPVKGIYWSWQTVKRRNAKKSSRWTLTVPFNLDLDLIHCRFHTWSPVPVLTSLIRRPTDQPLLAQGYHIPSNTLSWMPQLQIT